MTAKNETIQALESIGDTVEAFKHVYDKRVERLGDENAKLRERIELLEAGADRPRGIGAGFSRAQEEYKGVFVEWLRNPLDQARKTRLSEASLDLSTKDISIGTASAGGYALPEEISRQIAMRVQQLNPFRQLVRVEQCGSNDFKALLSMGDATTGWSTETGTRSATNSPTLRERAPTFGELYALATSTQWALDDIFFNVQDWIVNEVSAQFSSAEATAIVSGNGSARPTGFLNSTPTTSTDNASPMRAAGVLEYIPAGSYSSPYSITYRSLVDLAMSIQEKYLAGSQKVAWVMRRTALAHVRKLIDDNGQPIWTPGAVVGTPATLLGYPVYTTDAMPAFSAGNYPIAFGAWDQGYLLADRTQIRILVDPYSTPGMVRFYVSKRVGGCVYNNDAVKMLKYAVS